MVDRIRGLLSARQLTPTQFADTIGVARPIVSHILSGRNKPSLEVVQKIVDAFPDVSLTWLLKGIGSMTAVESTATVASPAPPATKRTGTKSLETARPAPLTEHTIPVAPTAVSKPVALVSETISATPSSVGPKQRPVPPETLFSALDVTTTPAPNTAASNQPELAVPVAPASVTNNSIPAGRFKPDVAVPTTAEPTREKNSGAVLPSEAQSFLRVDKAIRRIVVFYQDGTFTDYQPESV